MLRDHSSSPLWYHGGAQGLEVGDLLRPGRELPELPRYKDEAYRDMAANHVHVTRDLDVARYYAGSHPSSQRDPGGDLYLVEPLGPLEIDPDYNLHPEAFRRCDAARILRVVERGVVLDERSELAQSRYRMWHGSDRMYDDEGYLLPSAIWRRHGFTAKDFRQFGRFVEYNDGRVKRFIIDQLAARQRLLRR